MTVTQLKRLLACLKANHERLSDDTHFTGYADSTLCIENLASITFVTGQIGRLLNEG